MIAFFGMGLLGSNFVRSLVKQGETVQVWNRTAARAKPLEEIGVRVFEEPAAAARGATRVHITVKDDEAVDSVIERATPGCAPGTIIVDHTTTSAPGAKGRAERLRQQGFRFLHAPVFMGPQNALEATGIMLASGEKEIFEAVKPALEKMTGKLSYLGPDPARAAGMKLLGNLFLMSMTTGLRDLFALSKALGIPAEEGAELFSLFNPAVTIAPRVKRILDKTFKEPSWELQMARKDARLMLEAAEEGGVSLAAIGAIAEEMDRWIERGHAKDDWTVIAKDVV